MIIKVQWISADLLYMLPGSGGGQIKLGGKNNTDDVFYRLDDVLQFLNVMFGGSGRTY